MPPTLPRHLRLEARQPDGQWQVVATFRDNEKRCLIWKLPEPVTTSSLRLVIESGWSEDPEQRISLFALEFGDPEETGPIQQTSFPEPYDWRKRTPQNRA